MGRGGEGSGGPAEERVTMRRRKPLLSRYGNRRELSRAFRALSSAFSGGVAAPNWSCSSSSPAQSFVIFSLFSHRFLFKQNQTAKLPGEITGLNNTRETTPIRFNASTRQHQNVSCHITHWYSGKGARIKKHELQRRGRGGAMPCMHLAGQVHICAA